MIDMMIVTWLHGLIFGAGVAAFWLWGARHGR